ncbi:hypothetical protein BO83DRAFT_375568 [Aspergillus eucalypticola CBS 122712]|uniref:Glycine zipper 2TM domain-containing protein n=1 Tax=Aspergillus eucalypticola (strain CBS 122712 / IBT 29274) TaxID=1448314 RepID=A0A317W8M1_ASPEC|nr:uncharacterized protein BO83DRAFT_375568 [Aspergillus eucalypticola CBS 122712]PWY81368.1 hypothetical protein BO83DRAFT_375568 [Aspergillus eucalypticola CBS 122712]
MTDPYPHHQQQPYPSSVPNSETPYYSPPDGVYQHAGYDYEPQQFYNQHALPNQDPAYSSQYDVSQIPRSYPTQWNPQAASSNTNLNNVNNESNATVPQYDPDRLAPGYEPLVRRGSNAEYYAQSAAEMQAPPPAPPAPETQQQSRAYDNDPTTAGGGAAAGKEEEEGERSLGGAVLGGATGYYLGHKKDHGLLGAVGGAILGNFVSNKMKKSDSDEEVEEVEVDDDRETEYTRYHSNHYRRSSSHGHGHGHHHHHHHHHHHGHGHEHRSRSRSRYEEEEEW